MEIRVTTLAIALLALSQPASAGNSSSNSSSNSSNGIHTRVDSYITDNGRGRVIYERRVLRERESRGNRSWRRYGDDDDDD